MISKGDYSGRYYENEDEVPWIERPHLFIEMIIFGVVTWFIIACLFGVITW